jgi:VanZ family protein
LWRAAGLLTWGSLSAAFPTSQASDVMAQSVSPHSGGTVPDLHRVPFPLAGVGAEPTIARVAARLASAWVPVLLWAGLIFAFSSIPSLGTGLGTWDLALRKLAHASEYAVLGLLLARAVRRELPAVLLGIAYAASDELHQHFVPGRHGAVYDVAIDAVGVVVGVYLARRMTRRPAL